MEKQVNVHIGQVKVTSSGEELKAILGSCVGVGLLWRSRNTYGLAHCFLPKSPEETFEIGGRYVDQAIRSLIALMKIRPENFPEIEAVVAGGGNMTAPLTKDNSELVGGLNASAAIEQLKLLGIRVIHSDLGGVTGRKIFINGEDGSYRVRTIPRMQTAQRGSSGE